MATYRLHVTAYTVTDRMTVEITGMVQVWEGGAWADVEETTLSIRAIEFRDARTAQDLAEVVRRHAAQGVIRKKRVADRLADLVPSLPAEVPLGEL